MTKNRDVLAELDSIEEYLNGLIGDEPLPGQESNKRRLPGELAGLRNIALNIVELAAEYSAGVTHHQRLERSMGCSLLPEQTAHLTGGTPPSVTADKARIAELEAQLAEVQKGQVNG